MINSSFKAECQIAFIAISSLHSFSVHFSHHTLLTHLEDLKCKRKTLAHCPGSVPTIGVHRWWISALEEFILGQCPRHSINKILRMTETFQDSALRGLNSLLMERICAYFRLSKSMYVPLSHRMLIIMEAAALKSSWIIFRFTSSSMKSDRWFWFNFSDFYLMSFLPLPYLSS